MRGMFKNQALQHGVQWRQVNFMKTRDLARHSQLCPKSVFHMALQIYHLCKEGLMNLIFWLDGAGGWIGMRGSRSAKICLGAVLALLMRGTGISRCIRDVMQSTALHHNLARLRTRKEATGEYVHVSGVLTENLCWPLAGLQVFLSAAFADRAGPEKPTQRDLGSDQTVNVDSSDVA